MFKSIILSFVIVLSVVNGNVSIREKKEKNQFVGLVKSSKKSKVLVPKSSKSTKNANQHGKADIGKLKVKSSLASSENVKEQACTIDPKGPKLVILLSFGHSGQNEVWNIMGKFTGEKGMKGFGEETTAYRIIPTEFVEKVEDEHIEAKRWLTNYMCHAQKASPDSYFVGFKWEPRYFSHKAHNVLKAIKSMDVPIKVVRLHRNYLEQIISEERSSILTRLGLLDVRCSVNNEACAYLRKEIGTKMHLHTSSLIARLDDRLNEEKSFDDSLKKMNIRHLHVHFHNLLHQTNMAEWRRILGFLGKPKKVTAEDRVKSMILANVSVNNIETEISNFEFVKLTLKASKFEHLLE